MLDQTKFTDIMDSENNVILENLDDGGSISAPWDIVNTVLSATIIRDDWKKYYDKFVTEGRI